MDDIVLRLTALETMHPRLLWHDIAAAALVVLEGMARPIPYRVAAEFENVPGYGSGQATLIIDPSGFATDHLQRLRRTYEPPRLVELAAIAIAGLALNFAVRVQTTSWIMWAIGLKSRGDPEVATPPPRGINDVRGWSVDPTVASISA